MGRHVIIGAGPVGRTLAATLQTSGESVRLVNRSGDGPPVAGVERLAADAADAGRLTELAAGADALYNCLNPTAYHRWATEWPPMAAALLGAAERSGAVLVTTGNLYPYGPRDAPMTETSPERPNGVKSAIRARMSAETMQAHRDGRLRAVEVRASDYVGVGAYSHLNRVLPAALQGRTVRVLGDPNAPHSWTFVPDLAAALARAAGEPKLWGSIWLAPTAPPRSQAEAVADICRAAGRDPVKVKAIPGLALRAAGLVSPTTRELQETRYQFQNPYVVDSSVSESALGVFATPWPQVCALTAEYELARIS